MKIASAAYLALTVAIVLHLAAGNGFVSSTQEIPEHVSPAKGILPRFKAAIAKLFNFQSFKLKFGKQYASITEELARERIFLARSFRAFISHVAFKHRKQDFYLKVYENSDWTQSEFGSIELNPGYSNDVKGPPMESSSATPETVADIEDINKQLELIEKNNHNLGFKEISDELSSLNHQRVSSLSELDEIPSESFYELSVAQDQLVGGIKPETSDSDGMDQHWKKINSLPGASFLRKTMDSFVGKFTGWLGAESSKSEGEGEDNNIPMATSSNILTVDHRNCLQRARNQGKCGSCYIHSTMALYEWLYCHETGGEKLPFSEQYALDCGSRIKMKGCDGGPESLVAEFVGKYGLDLRNNYPYRKRADTCPYEPKVGPKKMGYIKVNQMGLRKVPIGEVDKLIGEYPLVVGIGISDRFQEWGGGIDDGSVCDKKRGHSVLISGMGEENGVQYWLLRNSYGHSFGEEGYYRLSRKATHCILDGASAFYLQQVRGAKVFNEKNQFYDIEPIRQRYLDYKSGKLVMPLHNAKTASESPNTTGSELVTPKEGG